MPFDLGDTVRLTADSTDPGGTLTNASAVALTVTLPDGTTVTPSVTNPPASVGRYQYDYATSQAGRHAVRWVFTDPGSAYTDSFDVRPAAAQGVLSLADAKQHLNLRSSTGEDEEIRGWIDATTRAVEHFVGPIARRTVVEVWRERSSRQLALQQIPALALTSVEAVATGGTSYDVSDLDLDGETGVVVRKDGGVLYGPLRITYAVGRTLVTANIAHGARIILQHLWRTQRGSGRGPAVAGTEDYSVTEPIPGLGYAIPNRALELLEPDRLPPGVG